MHQKIWVDSAGMLKRLRPAPQGRAHRIRKRASHITLVIDRFHATEKTTTPEAIQTRKTEQIDGAES